MWIFARSPGEEDFVAIGKYEYRTHLSLFYIHVPSKFAHSHSEAALNVGLGSKLSKALIELETKNFMVSNQKWANAFLHLNLQQQQNTGRGKKEHKKEIIKKKPQSFFMLRLIKLSPIFQCSCLWQTVCCNYESLCFGLTRVCLWFINKLTRETIIKKKKSNKTPRGVVQLPVFLVTD